MLKELISWSRITLQLKNIGYNKSVFFYILNVKRITELCKTDLKKSVSYNIW